jgi:protein O-GlcNAc transferase
MPHNGYRRMSIIRVCDYDPSRPRVSEIFKRDDEHLAREVKEQWRSLLAESLDAAHADRRDEQTWARATEILRKLERHEEAISIVKQGLAHTSSLRLYHQCVNLLEECNRTEEAIAFAVEARSSFPEDVSMRLKEALILPVVYDSLSEIERFRRRFTAGLAKVCGEIELDNPERRIDALAALGARTNFYLGYQGLNDRDLQVQYGDLAHRIMAAQYPQWAQPLTMPPVRHDELLRIGYVSARFQDLSAMRYFLGWLREHDRSRFAIHAYHMGGRTDGTTDEVRQISQVFHHFPGMLEEACLAIRAANLHVLVFLDIGLDPIMTQMAALRLARVQCMAWDQPITSGLPTVDYFLSSNLAEPERGQDHYSERLLRLPGVGVLYRKPVIPAPLLSLTRQDFQLRDEATVYLCCQHVYKFLPGNDWIFAEIARRVPNAQFVFLALNKPAGADLQARLDRAFAAACLPVSRHCIMLPQLKPFDYWNLHLVADVFLDTIGWSSGASVFEAIGCRLPVITVPGELMRSRQAYAILTQLGVTQTIALDNDGYVDIAVRIATDQAFREDVKERMVRGYPLLYSDRRCVTSLEEFFREVQRAPEQL